MFGSWGYTKFKNTPDEYTQWDAKDISVRSMAHNDALTYGLCNEHGQLNKVGQILFDKMYADGLLKNAHVMTLDTHCVVQPKAIQALQDHYDITTPALAKEVAENIVGQELSQEMIDEPTADWDSLAKQIRQS